MELDEDGDEWGTPVHAVFPQRLATRTDEVFRDGEDEVEEEQQEEHSVSGVSTPKARGMQELGRFFSRPAM